VARKPLRWASTITQAANEAFRSGLSGDALGADPDQLTLRANCQPWPRDRGSMPGKIRAKANRKAPTVHARLAAAIARLPASGCIVLVPVSTASMAAARRRSPVRLRFFGDENSSAKSS
jgi:hypothetical protein